jgi:hypothetical protein
MTLFCGTKQELLAEWQQSLDLKFDEQPQAIS